MEQVKIGGATVGAYVYNANNQRTKKTAGTTVTHYVYGLGGLLYGEYDNTGALIREYVYLNGQPLAQVDSGEVLSYLHTDHLGTPRYATNASGSQVWHWDSDAFGVGTPSGSATVNLRFAGQYWDDESGLHYNWNRYYDPTTGRYISSDPIGLAGGLNTYVYAFANPIMYTDPEGLSAVAKKIAGRLLPGVGQACNIYDATTILTACALDPRFCEEIAKEVLTGKPNTADDSSSSSKPKPKSDGGATSGLGDLTNDEVDQIQDAVDKAGRPVDVVGSAAKGERKEGSDIDYTTSSANEPYFDKDSLAEIDEHGILSGVPDVGTESIRFEPNQKPKKVDN